MAPATTRLTRAERREQTREELLDAAYRVFTQRGFHAASLDLVAGEAGYTKGAVYSNFASKEDLFFALYERRVEELVARLVADADRHTGPEIARRTLESRREGDDGWLAVFFEFWAHVLRNPALRERFSALHTRAREPLVAHTRAWAQESGSDVDPERLTIAIFAMVSGLGLEQLTDPSLDSAGVGAEVLDRIWSAR